MTGTAVQERNTDKVWVTPWGGDRVELEHSPGRTVEDYLLAAEMTIAASQSVVVNSETITVLDRPVEPFTSIVAADKPANG